MTGTTHLKIAGSVAKGERLPSTSARHRDPRTARGCNAFFALLPSERHRDHSPTDFVSRSKRACLLAVACAVAIMVAAVPVQGAGEDAGRGKATYGELCAKCHGSAGKGDGKEAATLSVKPKDLTDCPRMSAFTEDQLVRIVKGGGTAGGLSKDMPAYGDALDDAEIRDTLAYIESLCPK